MDGAVHPGAREAGFADLFEDSLVGALPSTYDRSQHQDAGAIGERFDGVHNFLRRLLDDLPPADGAVRDARTREQQTQVIINLGYGTNRRTRVMGSTLLVN